MILFALMMTVSSQASLLRSCLDWALAPVVGPPIKVEYRKFAHPLNSDNIRAEAVRVFSEPLGKDRAEVIGQYWAAKRASKHLGGVSGEVFRQELVWMREQLLRSQAKGEVLDKIDTVTVLASLDQLLTRPSLEYEDVVEVTQRFIERDFDEIKRPNLHDGKQPVWIAHDATVDDLILLTGAPINPIYLIPPNTTMFANGIEMDAASYVRHDFAHSLIFKRQMEIFANRAQKPSLAIEDVFSQQVHLNQAFLNWAERFSTSERELIKAIWFSWARETFEISPIGKLHPNALTQRYVGYFLRRIRKPGDFSQLFRHRDSSTLDRREVKDAVQKVRNFLSRIRWVEKK